MAAASLFSGLVKGLGSSLGQAYARKQAEDAQAKRDEFHLAMSALINDRNMPGSAKRLGLQKVFEITGAKVPDGLVEAIAPDYDVESGEYYAQDLPEMPQMEMTPPVEGADYRTQYPAQGQPRAGQRVSAMGQPPAPMQGKSAVPQQAGSTPMWDETGMAPMPRNPMVEPPMVFPDQLVPTESAAPVTSKYTGGMAGQIDELARKIEAAKADLRHGRPIYRSSLNYSEEQMQELRQNRLRDAEAKRQMGFDTIQGLTNQKRQLETFAAEQAARQEQELAMIPKKMAAELKALEAAKGQPLSEEERMRAIGLSPTGTAATNREEARDIQLANDATAPPAEREAALNRVTGRKLDNMRQIAAYQAQIIDIKKGIKDLNNPNGPDDARAMARLKVLSTKQASQSFGMADQDIYKKERAQYYQGELRKLITGEASEAGGDLEMLQLAQALKENPQQLAVSAMKMADRDVKLRREAIADAIFTYSLGSDLEVRTLNDVRQLAAMAMAKGGQAAANKVWDSYKSRIGKEVIILDTDSDDIRPWQP